VELKQKHRARLETEALEDRQLLAGHITFAPFTGIITIRGTPRADKAVVSYARGGGKVKVSVSGGWTGVAKVARAQVTEINFRGGGGRDRLINKTDIPVNGSAGPQAQPSEVVLSPDQLVIFQQTNLHRQGNGLAPLEVNALLQQVAQAHADNMARQDRFGDTDANGHILDGHDVLYRVGAVGYIASLLGENVAVGSGFANPAQELIDAWWNSPDHRAIILISDFTQIGVGVARSASGRTYGVQVFARPV
jgi:uncharacterized protein YkwD